MINFVVPGIAVAKGRPRFARRGARVVTYTPDKTAAYENAVATYAMAAMIGQTIMSACVEVNIAIHLTPPVKWSKLKKEGAIRGFYRPTTKPDLDNVAKSLCDAMIGVVYDDDSQIVVLSVSKWYGNEAKADISVRAL